MDQTKYLDLVMDPNRDAGRNRGQQPTAIMISRMLQAIVRSVFAPQFCLNVNLLTRRRRCPSIDISLTFERCRCESAPIASLGQEEFPRVKRLTLYLGKHDPDETHPRDHISCSPNAQFWQPLIGGDTFPDLRDLEVRHAWAASPPHDASMDLTTLGIRSPSSAYPPFPPFLRRARLGIHEQISPHTFTYRLDGLTRLERICLESPPELDSMIFGQLVGNPKATPVNLTSLDLRFCFLDSSTVAEFLHFAPPALKSLRLMCASLVVLEPMGVTPKDPPHLCELLREYSKRLEYLDYGSRRVCQSLFYDESELRLLSSNGLLAVRNANDDETNQARAIDAFSIRQLINESRQRSRTKTRERQVQEALQAARNSRKSSQTSRDATEISSQELADAQIRDVAERTLDDEEVRRYRQLNGRNQKWNRRIICLGRLCNSEMTWQGLQIGAELEEEGIEWVLASMSGCFVVILFSSSKWLTWLRQTDRKTKQAGQFTAGKPALSLKFKDAVSEGFRLRAR